MKPTRPIRIYDATRPLRDDGTVESLAVVAVDHPPDFLAAVARHLAVALGISRAAADLLINCELHEDEVFCDPWPVERAAEIAREIAPAFAVAQTGRAA